MDEDLSRIDSRVDELVERLRHFEQRLTALENHVLPTEAASPADIAAAPPPVTAADGTVQPASTPTEAALLPLCGRVLLVLAGAFLLRAITEAGVLPRSVGTGLGIAYALAWFVVADLAGRKRRVSTATFYGVAASMIVFPLIWEATVKVRFLSPPSGALALVFATAVGLVVVVRRRLEGLAWVITLGSALTALALAALTKMLVLFVALVLALGLAALWLGYRRGWRALGWVAAAVVDGSVLLLTVMMLLGHAERVAAILGAGPLVQLQLALVLAYCGSFVLRTLLRDEDVTVAEIAQAAVTLLIGLCGAIAVTRATGISGIPLAIVSLALAGGSYSAAFMLIDRRTGSRVTFIFYTTLALVFTLAGFVTLLRGAPLALAFSVVALSTAWLGSSRKRATLSLHASVYAVAAAGASGILLAGFEVFARPHVFESDWIDVTVLAVLLAVSACCWFPVATHGRTWGRLSGIPRSLMLGVLVIGVGALVVHVGSGWLARGVTPEREIAILAAFRTAVISAAAVLLAGGGRWRGIKEATWLTYPVLVAGGLKLLLEDVRAGNPLTLFVSFAMYGGALILASRLARRAERVA